jgi:o-succinylbenzoate synthase
VRTLIDFADAPIFAIPVIAEHSGGHGAREGMLIEGPQGWGEFSPPRDGDDREAERWLTAATEVGTVGWPDAVRGRIPVSVTVPAVDAAMAYQMVADSGCTAADVAVGQTVDSLTADIARLEAVRAALGTQGAIRCDAHGMWNIDTAVAAIAVLNDAAGGLQYVEQPCRTIEELASVRRRVHVRLAADESVRHAADPLRMSAGALQSLRDAVDVVVLKCGPLGGVRRSVRVAEICGIAAVVSSTVDTTIGLSAGLALAGALPELPFACGLGTRLLLAGDVVAGPRSLIPVDGHLPVAPTPPTPAPELLARYRVADADVIDWWRARLRTLTDPGSTPPRTP